MGMFDAFKTNFKCPKCSQQVTEVQTKQFDCLMKHWGLGDIFTGMGIIFGNATLTIPAACYNRIDTMEAQNFCDWREGHLRVDIESNVIVGYKGIGFDYEERIDLKEHLLKSLQATYDLKQRIRFLEKNCVEMLQFISDKNLDNLPEYRTLSRYLDVEKEMDLFAKLVITWASTLEDPIFRSWHPTYIGLHKGFVENGK